MGKIEDYIVAKARGLSIGQHSPGSTEEVIHLDIEGTGKWTVELTGAGTVTAGLTGTPFCTIRCTTPDMEAIIDRPGDVWPLFLDGKVRVSDPCRAAIVVRAVWGDVFRQAMPPQVYQALFSPPVSREPSSPEWSPAGAPALGYVITSTGLVELPCTERAGRILYQGDIVLGTASDMTRAKAAKTPSQLKAVRIIDVSDPGTFVWPDRTLPYIIDDDLPNSARIKTASANISNATNVTVEERDGQTNYVKFVSGEGCSSAVGMRGDEQEVTIDDDCSIGNVMHEILHALGMWHEQSRIDRDDYVTINEENILEGKEHNFERMDTSQAEDIEDYDYRSIMHYGQYAFAREDDKGKPVGTTIDCTDTSYQRRIGQRDTLSDGDVAGVNEIYPA